jgi:hypothetical protein
VLGRSTIAVRDRLDQISSAVFIELVMLLSRLDHQLTADSRHGDPLLLADSRRPIYSKPLRLELRCERG